MGEIPATCLLPSKAHPVQFFVSRTPKQTVFIHLGFYKSKKSWTTYFQKLPCLALPQNSPEAKGLKAERRPSGNREGPGKGDDPENKLKTS